MCLSFVKTGVTKKKKNRRIAAHNCLWKISRRTLYEKKNVYAKRFNDWLKTISTFSRYTYIYSVRTVCTLCTTFANRADDTVINYYVYGNSFFFYYYYLFRYRPVFILKNRIQLHSRHTFVLFRITQRARVCLFFF